MEIVVEISINAAHSVALISKKKMFVYTSLRKCVVFLKYSSTDKFCRRMCSAIQLNKIFQIRL